MIPERTDDTASSQAPTEIPDPARGPRFNRADRDVLVRLKATQCCDPVIDGLLGAAIEEIERLRKSVLNRQGDDLCWFDIGATHPHVKIPPAEEFLESCRRFHEQVAGDSGLLEGCMTIAQLEAEVERLRAALAQHREQVTNDACGDALELLWKEIILANRPDYGEWEYPGQAYRHILAEFKELERSARTASSQTPTESTNPARYRQVQPPDGRVR